MFVTIHSLSIQGLYNKAPLTQHYSPSVSGLVARLLTTDPELRPSARAILKSLILLNESVSVHNLDTLQVDDVSVSLDKLALEENPGQADSGNGDRFDKKWKIHHSFLSLFLISIDIIASHRMISFICRFLLIGLVARLLTTEPERPSARESLENQTIHDELISVTLGPNTPASNLDTKPSDVSVSPDKPALEEALEGPAENHDSGDKDRIGKQVERSVRHGAKNLERSIRHKLKKKKRKNSD